jgi:hypothetical protein
MQGASLRFGGRAFRAVVLALGTAILLLPSLSSAQLQNLDKRKCIVGMNKAVSKVAGKQQRRIGRCVKDAVRGQLSAAPGSMDSCLTSDPRVAAAIAKVQKVETKKCTTTPDFGYVGSATASAAAVAQELALFSDLFGSDVDSLLEPSSISASTAPCYRTIAKAYTRLSDARSRAFLDCKKDGLANGDITSSAELGSCFDAIDLDSKGKIAKAYQKLAKGFLKRCLGLPVGTNQLFPGACAGQPDFLNCVADESRCRTCLTLNQVDDLDRECELYDNGLADASCIDPAANECAGENGGNNCNENATCIDTVDGFDCVCDSGYEGNGVNCTEIDECSEGTDNCDANAACINVPGSFDCVCNNGFAGDGVTCVDENECLGEGSGHDCDVNATCSNTVGGYLCECNAGWIGTGQACIDRNECALNIDGCDVKAVCTNLPGTWDCTCIPGYGGDGFTCTDFNECLGEGGGNNCSVNGVCTNTPGSFSCACLPGFGGDGISCVDFNECLGEGGGDNCSAFATCTNTSGSFDCDCIAGYAGDGVTCVDENECLGEGSGNNCSINANCSNLPGTFDCTCRDGYYGNPVGSVCDPITVTLTSPQHGIFSQASSVNVTGIVVANPLADVELTLMAGDDPAVVIPINGDGTFSATLPLDPVLIFNGIRAEVTQLSTGFTVRDRVVVIAGDSRPFGGLVEQTVGLRITDSGFADFGSILTDLVDLDIATLLPAGTKVLDDECFLAGIICVDATITSASLNSFALTVDSQVNSVHGQIVLNFLDVNVSITGGISCGLRIRVNTTYIDGDYALEPDPSDATVIDVNQLADVAVSFSNFQSQFTSGVCDAPIIGDIIQAIVGDIEPLMRDGFRDFLADPDGTGPQDAPIAQAIEDTLGAVELTGPIGEGFGVNLDTPLFAIPEDNAGITLASGAIMSTLNPAPGAPTFSETLYIPQTFPFAQLQSGLSPNGIPYDMAIAMSDSGFNQILAAQVESGLLGAEITEIELLPGTGVQPITAGLLSSFFAEFGQLDPALELKLKIIPTLAPVLTGNTGANGEIAEFVLSHLLVQIVTVNAPEMLYGELATDILMDFDLVVDAGSGNLLPILGEPAPENIAITLLTNPLGLSEAALQLILPDLLGPLVPGLSGAFGAFPLPAFLGLQPTAVDVVRTGDFMGIYLEAVPAP